MSECSFCGTVEEKEYPLCHSCGALRYPVEKNGANITSSRRQKLKFSATVAAAIVTPGAFVVLAVIGAKHIKKNLESGKYNE